MQHSRREGMSGCARRCWRNMARRWNLRRLDEPRGVQCQLMREYTMRLFSLVVIGSIWTSTLSSGEVGKTDPKGKPKAEFPVKALDSLTPLMPKDDDSELKKLLIGRYNAAVREMG